MCSERVCTRFDQKNASIGFWQKKLFMDIKLFQVSPSEYDAVKRLCKSIDSSFWENQKIVYAKKLVEAVMNCCKALL